MSEPTKEDIEIAYKYAVWLRGTDPLNRTERTVCDLGHEVKRLREAVLKAQREQAAALNEMSTEQLWRLRERITEAIKGRPIKL